MVLGRSRRRCRHRPLITPEAASHQLFPPNFTRYNVTKPRPTIIRLPCSICKPPPENFSVDAVKQFRRSLSLSLSAAAKASDYPLQPEGEPPPPPPPERIVQRNENFACYIHSRQSDGRAPPPPNRSFIPSVSLSLPLSLYFHFTLLLPLPFLSF